MANNDVTLKPNLISSLWVNLTLRPDFRPFYTSASQIHCLCVDADFKRADRAPRQKEISANVTEPAPGQVNSAPHPVARR
jgi:hypothetical protein